MTIEELKAENQRLRNGLIRMTEINDDRVLADTTSVLVVCNLFKHIARETLDPDRI